MSDITRNIFAVKRHGVCWNYFLKKSDAEVYRAERIRTGYADKSTLVQKMKSIRKGTRFFLDGKLILISKLSCKDRKLRSSFNSARG